MKNKALQAIKIQVIANEKGNAYVVCGSRKKRRVIDAAKH